MIDIMIVSGFLSIVNLAAIFLIVLSKDFREQKEKESRWFRQVLTKTLGFTFLHCLLALLIGFVYLVINNDQFSTEATVLERCEESICAGWALAWGTIMPWLVLYFVGYLFGENKNKVP